MVVIGRAIDTRHAENLAGGACLQTSGKDKPLTSGDIAACCGLYAGDSIGAATNNYVLQQPMQARALACTIEPVRYEKVCDGKAPRLQPSATKRKWLTAQALWAGGYEGTAYVQTHAVPKRHTGTRRT